jgi:hypothetical protein
MNIMLVRNKSDTSIDSKMERKGYTMEHAKQELRIEIKHSVSVFVNQCASDAGITHFDEEDDSPPVIYCVRIQMNIILCRYSYCQHH